MNGRFAFLSPSLLGPLSILLSRCIFLGLELSTSTMGSLILLLIVFVFSGWYMVSSAVKVLLRLADFLLPMIWCWLFWQSLDLHLPDHCMFWAACSLGYFGFLRASEFTVPNLPSFSSSLHQGVQDISVDSPSAPSCMRVRIKGSETDPFRKGCFIQIGVDRRPLCAVRAAQRKVRNKTAGTVNIKQLALTMP